MVEKREVILSLGSNINDRKSFIEQAILELKSDFQTEIRQSSIYETEPWGFDAELPFLNCCVVLKSLLNPEEILNITQNIEKKMGRLRNKNKNIYHSRTIDIDILFVGNIKYNSKDLQIPHPHLYNRNFVLTPLSELRPQFVDPITNLSIKELINQCNDKKKVILYEY